MLNTLQRLTKLTSWHHADVSPSIPHRTPTQNHVWLEADRQWSRTSSLWRRGSNCRLCPPGRWQKSHFAESGARFVEIMNAEYSQFTICSSTSSNALLTALPFFQLLRQSGKPWVTLYTQCFKGAEVNHNGQQHKWSPSNDLDTQLCGNWLLAQPFHDVVNEKQLEDKAFPIHTYNYNFGGNLSKNKVSYDSFSCYAKWKVVARGSMMLYCV